MSLSIFFYSNSRLSKYTNARDLIDEGTHVITFIKRRVNKEDINNVNDISVLQLSFNTNDDTNMVTSRLSIAVPYESDHNTLRHIDLDIPLHQDRTK